MYHTGGPAAAEPLWHVLYRFFWPFQYFRDVTQGSKLERQLNYRHNRSMRPYLPGFVLKWSLMTAMWWGFGGMFDSLLGLVIPAACCFMTGSWSAIVVVMLGVAWVWLERFPELF